MYQVIELEPRVGVWRDQMRASKFQPNTIAQESSRISCIGISPFHLKILSIVELFWSFTYITFVEVHCGRDMGEVVNVLVAFAVIVFLFRWVTSSGMSYLFCSMLVLTWTNQQAMIRQIGQLQIHSASDQKRSLRIWCVVQTTPLGILGSPHLRSAVRYDIWHVSRYTSVSMTFRTIYPSGCSFGHGIWPEIISDTTSSGLVTSN